QCELEETEIASAGTVGRDREGGQLRADPCRDEDGEGDDGGGHSGIGQGGRGSVVMCGARGGYADDLMLASNHVPCDPKDADNPVDWRMWTKDALAEAARRDVPLLISIGYSTCHWCHVMAHESFEDEALAALLNDRFVPVKIDREELPDIDSYYMNALQAMT